MFYNFNNFTGRLIGVSHFQPYYPVSSRPLAKDEPPKIIFESPRIKLAQAPPPPSASASASAGASGKPVGEGGIPQALKDKQRLFQKHDGVPVYLKGGPADKVLLGITLALGVVGFSLAFKHMYEAAFPKKA